MHTFDRAENNTRLCAVKLVPLFKADFTPSRVSFSLKKYATLFVELRFYFLQIYENITYIYIFFSYTHKKYFQLKQVEMKKRIKIGIELVL